MIERLSTRETARRLGISVATVRRKIAAGELHAVREQRPQGERWLVLFDTSVDASRYAPSDSAPRITSAHANGNTNGHHGELALALDTIADLRRRLDAAEQAQAELRQLLAREQETVRALRSGSARPTAQITSPGTSHAPTTVSAPSVPRRRPRSLLERLVAALRGP